jgi:spermidine/putrescine transport system permease protein
MMRGWGRRGLMLFAILGFLFVYLPMVTLIVFSFNGPQDADDIRREWVFGTGQWHGFTLEWYNRLLADEDLQEAFWNSMSVAGLTVLISLLLGTMTAYVLYRRKFWGKGLFEQVLYIPLFMPGTVVGVSTLMLFRFIHLPRGFWAILAAHVAFTIPLVTLVVLARMQRINWSLEEAALDLGASPFRTMRSVIFPLLRPGIFAAGLLAFPWSFNDFVITFFLHGPRFDTLPIMIYSMAGRSGAVTPRINALGTMVLVGSLLLIGIGFLLQRRREHTST